MDLHNILSPTWFLKKFQPILTLHVGRITHQSINVMVTLNLNFEHPPAGGSGSAGLDPAEMSIEQQ